MNILSLNDRSETQNRLKALFVANFHKDLNFCVASSVQEGMQYLKRDDPNFPFDIIILDTNMDPTGLTEEETAQTARGYLSGWICFKYYAAYEYKRENKVIVLTPYAENFLHYIPEDERWFCTVIDIGYKNSERWPLQLIDTLKKYSEAQTHTLREFVLEKIANYHAQNGLDYVAKFFLSMSSVRHGKVTGHTERVALLAEAVAGKMKMDTKAAFFAGLLHDVGKIVLPSRLFEGYDISQEEYEEVKQHAILGADALKEDYPFTSLCAGLHHAMYHHGYGLTLKDFPEQFSPATAKKVLQIATIVSICDFIEAFTHRGTKMKDGSDKAGLDLRGLLYAKYPNDAQLIDIALEEFPKIVFWNEE